MILSLNQVQKNLRNILHKWASQTGINKAGNINIEDSIFERNEESEEDEGSNYNASRVEDSSADRAIQSYVSSLANAIEMERIMLLGF